MKIANIDVCTRTYLHDDLPDHKEGQVGASGAELLEDGAECPVWRQTQHQSQGLQSQTQEGHDVGVRQLLQDGHFLAGRQVGAAGALQAHLEPLCWDSGTR